MSLKTVRSREVPEYFQDQSLPALLNQVNFLLETLDISDDFFGRLLHVDIERFKDWRHHQKVHLSSAQTQTLHRLWRLHLHLLSLFDSDLAKVKTAYSTVASREAGTTSCEVPWKGESITNYIARTGNKGIEATTRFVLALRFADPY